ncbi:acyl carrier protein-like protein [Phialemonium atrogriseum]|uniref:Acyl carrier protein n=1 Tax=Phialemonium atrogriseum TaxID=1093897 RepID=A0AAJ0BY26_9PEZI|nr:acyl carrier protein-like protein [Phialemonium atrogriseum]KAK1766599.1 acyl carrier protein-like protein [Phialemonium atrogriseum]
MLRSAIFRSSLAARSAIRPAAANSARRIAAVAVPRSSAAAAFAPRAAAWSGVRCFASAGGLNKEEVEGRIKALLQGFDKVNDASKISSTAHFANDLGLDSLDTVEVVMAIEEEFSIEIPDKDADTIHSVDKAVEYIVSQPDAN